MKTYLKTLFVSLALVSCTQALATQTTFIFDRLTDDSKEQCQNMSLDQLAKTINITIDLSPIKTPFIGLPSIASYSGISLAATPDFFFMGLKDRYAYMSRATDAVIENKSFHGVNFSLVSKDEFTGYQGALRLNDAEGNHCMVLLKQSA